MNRTSLVLRLGLGILCGLTLVLLPAAFSSAPTANSSAHTAGTNGQFNPSVQPQAAPFGLSSASAGGISFLAIILFVFLPSIIFSLVIRRWAEKRARECL